MKLLIFITLILVLVACAYKSRETGRGGRGDGGGRGFGYSGFNRGGRGWNHGGRWGGYRPWQNWYSDYGYRNWYPYYNYYYEPSSYVVPRSTWSNNGYQCFYSGNEEFPIKIQTDGNQINQVLIATDYPKDQKCKDYINDDLSVTNVVICNDEAIKAGKKECDKVKQLLGKPTIN